MGRKLPTEWRPYHGSKRREDVIRELWRYNGMLSLQDRSEKYKRMALSPFAFYRGTAHLYYHDLKKIGLPESSSFHNGETRTWIQGDLHINNFGAFCTGEGEVVFDLNDFDEAWIAPYYFDVLRGASSLCLQGQENDFSNKKIHDFVVEFCKEYLDSLERHAGGLDYALVTAANTHGPLKAFLEKAEKHNSRRAMLEDWTVLRRNKRGFATGRSKLEPVSKDDYRILSKAVALYKDHLDSPLRGREDYFTVLDVARRLGAGVGSLGTPRYYILIRGETDDPDEDHILDVKEQGLPSYFPILSRKEKAGLLNRFNEERAGLRVATAQKAMLTDPDPTLGYITILGRSFSVRERSPFKKAFKLHKLNKTKHFLAMSHHWGTILGTAHARGNDADPDLSAHAFEHAVLDLVKGKRDEFMEEVAAFAFNYAEQVDKDFQLFKELLEAEDI